MKIGFSASPDWVEFHAALGCSVTAKAKRSQPTNQVSSQVVLVELVQIEVPEVVVGDFLRKAYDRWQPRFGGPLLHGSDGNTSGLVCPGGLAHHRRRIVHFNLTEYPKAGWTGPQTIEASPDDTAPRYLLRDRDKIYACAFRERIRGLSILSAPASPRQRSPRGEADRIGPARVPGSCHRAGRRASAKDFEKLSGGLSLQPDSLGLGKDTPNRGLFSPRGWEHG
jgi:hypothetical protein